MDKRRLILIIIALLIISFILFSVMTGLAIYIYFRILTAPIEPIKAQLQALNETRIVDAYNKYTAPQFKQKTSLQAFTDLVEKNPQIFQSKNSNFDEVSISNNRAVVKGTITGQDGTETPMTYTLGCTENRWLILGFRQGKNTN